MSNGIISVTEGAGKNLDTEQLTVGANTVQRERVQIAGSTATQIAPVDATAGLKVDLGADNDVTVTSSALPSGAATLAEQQTQTASLSVLDDWDETDRAKVNLIAGQAGITAGAGAVAANTPRTTLASDDPAVAVLGATTGAAVVTDANGTIQQYLRGLVKGLLVTGLNVISLISTRKVKYGTTNVAITATTLNSLATTNRMQTTAVDNTSNLFEDALVQVKITAGAASTVATGYAEIFAYGTADTTTPTYGEGGTSDPVDGTDGTVTLTNPPNLQLIGTMNIVANNGVYISNPMSVAAAFGGRLPGKWGLVIGNQSGGTFAGSGNAVWYQGVQGQTT